MASFFEGSPDIAESNKKYCIRRDEIELLEVVGEGAFGKVYRGKYNLAAVAVKTLKGSGDDKSMQSLKEEAQVLMNLKPHPK